MLLKINFPPELTAGSFVHNINYPVTKTGKLKMFYNQQSNIRQPAWPGVGQYFLMVDP